MWEKGIQSGVITFACFGSLSITFISMVQLRKEETEGATLHIAFQGSKVAKGLGKVAGTGKELKKVFDCDAAR